MSLEFNTPSPTSSTPLVRSQPLETSSNPVMNSTSAIGESSSTPGLTTQDLATSPEGRDSQATNRSSGNDSAVGTRPNLSFGGFAPAVGLPPDIQAELVATVSNWVMERMSAGHDLTGLRNAFQQGSSPQLGSSFQHDPYAASSASMSRGTLTPQQSVFLNTIKTPMLEVLAYENVLTFIREFIAAKHLQPLLRVVQCLSHDVTATLNTFKEDTKTNHYHAPITSHSQWSDDSVMEIILEFVMGTDEANARTKRTEQIRSIIFNFDPRHLASWNSLEQHIRSILTPWPKCTSPRLQAFYNQRRSAEYLTLLQVVRDKAKSVASHNHYTWLLERLNDDNLSYLLHFKVVSADVLANFRTPAHLDIDPLKLDNRERAMLYPTYLSDALDVSRKKPDTGHLILGMPETVNALLRKMHLIANYLALYLQPLGNMGFQVTPTIQDGSTRRDSNPNNNHHHSPAAKRTRVEQVVQPSTSKSHQEKASATPSVNSGAGGGRVSNTPCNCCGFPHQNAHVLATCKWRNHPDCNKQPNIPFLSSTNGKAYLAKFGHTRLKGDCTTGGKYDFQSSTYQGKSNAKPNFNNIKESSATSLQEEECTPCIISTINPNTKKPVSLSVSMFVDSGAVDDDYVSLRVTKQLQAKGAQINTNVACMVCAGLELGGQECTDCKGKLELDVNFINENTSLNEIFHIHPKIIKTPHDLIIGRNTMRKMNLPNKLPSIFGSSASESAGAELVIQSTDSLADPPELTISHQSTPQQAPPTVNVTSSGQLRWKGNSHDLLPDEDLQPSVDEEIMEYAPDWDNIIQQYEQLNIEDLHLTNPTEDDVIPTKIFGTPQMQQRIRQLCGEYRDVFSRAVRKQPANIPPMRLSVDENRWKTDTKLGNRRPARLQGTVRMAETTRQIQQMQSLGVIQHSGATQYSQVVLVPKPGSNKWRFCVDFKLLNMLTIIDQDWPIPVIHIILTRVGQKRPKIFGKIDMTSGYHQAPLHPDSWWLTAFITLFGIFEWVRVPMGLKGAASYFQRMMATVVLVGFIYNFLEVYLDDILIYAITEDEFISHLQKVFQRFREHNVTANPDKCEFGYDQVEYVGHTLNEHGMHFTDKKLREVYEFPEPVFQKQMKSFVGLATYFNSHVRNFATVAKPLHHVITPYKKHSKIVWTTQARKAFRDIKESIRLCPSLFYIDENAPIYLCTDASIYGIGAYLYQIIDGVERVIMFLSKSFTKIQLSWGIPDKEAFAILHTLKTLDYLLRDTKFILKTDHANLTYITADMSPKVQRWRQYISEYNFDIEFIEGDKNIVADSLSRLAEIPVENVNSMHNYFSKKIPEDKYTILRQVHNSIVGHFGKEKTIEKLILKIQRENREDLKDWPDMRAHVTMFIRRCPACQKMSHLKVPIHTHAFTAANYQPMAVLAMDTIGPLPKDRVGNEHILVIIDCFSRWIELYAIPDLTAITAAHCLLQHFGRFGTPNAIKHDGGSQFVNQVIKEFLQLLRTEDKTSLAYSKQENTIVERSNKEVLRHLIAIVNDTKMKDSWSQDLPFVQRIYNASRNEHLGASPAQILFGNAIDLDRNILFTQTLPPRNDREIQLSEWVGNMLISQNKIIHTAQQTQLQHDVEHLQSKPDKPTVFETQSLVLVAYPMTRMGQHPPTKLHTNWRGPLRVIGRDIDEYQIENLNTHAIEKVHVSRLKQFDHDERINPVHTSYGDNDEFVIEEVLEFRGDKKGTREQIEFLIKWEGYDSSQNTWEKASNHSLMKVQKVIDFCVTNKLKRLIPVALKRQKTSA